MDMDTDHLRIDNIVLLGEVSKHPMLYDKHHKQHTDVPTKRQLWKQVTMVVFADSWEEWKNHRRYNAVDEVVKRWQNLRSCFFRELRLTREEQSKSNKSRKRRKYFYYDNMKFLLECVEPQDESLRAENPDTTDADQDADQDDDQDGNEIDDFKLIAAVEKHPVLYKDPHQPMNVKRQAWETVCEEIVADWNEWDLNQKNEAQKDIQKRWRTLRHHLLRQYKIQKQTPNKRSRYTYYNSMKFLVDIWDKTKTPVEVATISNVKQEHYHGIKCEVEYEGNNEGNYKENVITEYDDSDAYRPKQSAKRTTSGSIVDPGVEFVDPLDDREMMAARSLDQDLNFALSLVPMLRDLPLSSKLQAQIDILKVFQSFSCHQT